MNAVHVTPSVRLICRARRGSAGSAGSVLGVPELVEHLGGMDHGLRRNAPDVEAHAADDSRSMMAVFTLSWPSRIAAMAAGFQLRSRLHRNVARAWPRHAMLAWCDRATPAGPSSRSPSRPSSGIGDLDLHLVLVADVAQPRRQGLVGHKEVQLGDVTDADRSGSNFMLSATRMDWRAQ